VKSSKKKKKIDFNFRVGEVVGDGKSEIEKVVKSPEKIAVGLKLDLNGLSGPQIYGGCDKIIPRRKDISKN
jgi:hypothetical protein